MWSFPTDNGVVEIKLDFTYCLSYGTYNITTTNNAYMYLTMNICHYPDIVF